MSLLTHFSHSYPATASRDRPHLDLFYPLRRWIDQITVTHRIFAHLVCRVIPCACPFERDITVFKLTAHIPALCKLNPLYKELVDLRFRSLSYLADDCGEDVTRYIC